MGRRRRRRESPDESDSDEEEEELEEVDEIEEYTRNFVPTPDKNAVDKWFNKIFS